MLNIQQCYHDELREAITRKFANVLAQATCGTCLKLSNLPLQDLLALREALTKKYPQLCVVILANDNDDNAGFVSATHLIELRNSEAHPLLALIPSGLQTPAEDSYGNATFNDLDISNIDNDIIAYLSGQIPPAILPFINEAEKQAMPGYNRIYFLLALQESKWDKAAIGLNLDYLGLIPDTTELRDLSIWKNRLIYNRICTGVICDFSTPVLDRIHLLQIAPDSNQREITGFLNSASTNDKFNLMHSIHDSPDFEKLDFASWKLPKIEDKAVLKISVGELKSKDMKLDGTDKVLQVQNGKTSTLKFRIMTEPSPKDFPSLKNFKIKLITTDGCEEYKVVKAAKVTESSRSYRDVSFKISATVFEEGTYYFRIIGEDESGGQLNTKDDFIDEQIQALWEQELETNGDHADYDEFKSQHRAKTTNETEDIRLVFEDEDQDDNDLELAQGRKVKLDNAIQAYFRYRIEELKNKKSPDFPQTTLETALWQKTSGNSLQSTFLLKLSSTHNYQIQISSKLREIERLFLEHCTELGHVSCTLHINSTIEDSQYKDFIQFDGARADRLLDLREKVFRSILNSAPDESGIFETWLGFCSPENIDVLRQYVCCYKDFIATSQKADVSADELGHLQNLDIVDLQAQSDDGKTIHVKLLPPLHPLRLAWFVDLYDLFSSWEDRSWKNSKHKKEWTKELTSIFLGGIYPTNSPLILANNSYSYYQYAGELVFGWGIYSEAENKKGNWELSNDRQIKIYFAELLNLSCDSRLDSDVSQSLIERYILDYLKQHPYSNKVIVNIFNPGDGASFVKAIIDLEQQLPDKYQYEFRLCCENDFVAPGEAFRDLMNPENNISDMTENFSTASQNRLFPKIRFSLNKVSEFTKNPFDFIANLSFLINPFSAKCELLKADQSMVSDALNGLVVHSQPVVRYEADSIQWGRIVYCDEGSPKSEEFFYQGNQLLNDIQLITASLITPQNPEKRFPGDVVSIKTPEKTLLSLIHDCSDWVITFDRGLGPEIFDSQNDNCDNPYLLDYVPNRDLNGISAFLTTKPSMEAYSFLLPYLKKIGLESICSEKNIFALLEDIRTISGSLLIQAISTNNRAFEVIGMALTKRLLEKKGYLNNAFLIPLDLHRDLFNLQEQGTHERADLMIVQCDPKSRELHFDVVEIKCRTTLIGDETQEDLFAKISDQIDHSIEAFKDHFEICEIEENDRLDRQVKCMELRKLLTFYIKRAGRFQQLDPSVEKCYLDFCSSLPNGYSLTFGKLQIIYNFSAEKDQEKTDGEDFIRYVIGKGLIAEIVSPNDTLETFKLEDSLRLFNLPIKDLTTPAADKTAQGKRENDELDKSPAKPVPVSIPPLTEPVPDPVATKKGTPPKVAVPEDYPSKKQPLADVNSISYDTIIGGNKKDAIQAGVLGLQRTTGKKIALDLAKTTAISLFGVQGAGKSYTIGTITEMVVKQIHNINQLPSPLAGVIFHYSESVDYKPEFISMKMPNDKVRELEELLETYNARPDAIQDIVLLTTKDKVDERKQQYPNIDVEPIAFSSKDLDVASWLFLLGAVGNESLYIKQVKAIMKSIRNNLTMGNIRKEVQESPHIQESNKALVENRLSLAQEYINDDISLKSVLRPGRLVIIDLRDEFIEKGDALKLFVVMLNIFSSVQSEAGKHFNKFIVFDEAHKYMDNKELSSTIATAIKEMRHKGVSIMIASQDPTGLPPEIIELSSILMMHRFNSPAWLKHIQKAITQTAALTPSDLASLKTGEAFIWANEASDPQFTTRPIKVKMRPRVTKHGGTTINATDTQINL